MPRRFEGPELAHVAVANALGVRIDRRAVIESRRAGVDSIRWNWP